MSHWVKTLAKGQPWETAYPLVAEAALGVLAGISKDKAIGTAQLVALLWPGQGPRDAVGKAAMARMYQALKALADHDLSQCVYRGEPEPSRWGKPIRRLFWHEPKVMVVVDDRKAWIKENNPELYASLYAPLIKPGNTK